MKKISLIIAVATLAVSCHTETFDAASAVGTATDEIAAVSVNDAVENMYSFMDKAYGQGTRAAARTIADINSFSTRAASTRAGEVGSDAATGTDTDTGSGSADAKCELAYVVNFAEGGFAVLGARETVPEVLCITDDGLFEPGEIAELARELLEPAATPVISDMIVSTDPIRFIKKEVLAYALAADVEGTREASVAKWERQNARVAAAAAEGWSDWTDFTQAGPLLSTLWNQTYPFNKECPPDPRDDRRTSYSGCVAMALAQIIAHNEQPAPQTISSEATSPWGDIKSQHYNPSKTAIRTTRELEIEDDMAAIIHEIGKGVDMDYSYYDGSAASSSKAESFLQKNNMGYKKVIRQIWYNSTHITDMLDAGKPVYISAAGDGGAHAWVIDGSVHQKRTRTVDGQLQTERRFMLHCNFGWGGTANGYYFSRTFTPNEGPVDTETGVDASKPGSNGRNYNSQYQIIQYEL